MELRRAADALLRSQASPLAAFLAPSASLRCSQAIQLHGINRRSINRTFTSTAYRPASSLLQPVTTSSEKTAKASGEEDPNAIAQSLWANESHKPRKGAGRFSSRITPAGSREASERSLNQGNSASDLMSSYNALKPNRDRGSEFNISRMATPKSGSKMVDMLKVISSDLGAPGVAKIPLRLNPTTGRTVTLGAGLDVGRGFRMLEQSCARNKVRPESRAQKFHERPGLKRKRLLRTRWRKRFMIGFKAAVDRVKELKKQGW